MIDLRQARITDAVPYIVKEQAWVKAMAAAYGVMTSRMLDAVEKSQIYTNLEQAPEAVLDALAVYWKVDWYDTSYPVEIKRRMIQSALTVWRTAGTLAAVKTQMNAIYPNSDVTEWFDYGGEPGHFRVRVDVTEEGVPQEIHKWEEINRMLMPAKRYSAHLDDVEFFVRPSGKAKLHTGVAHCESYMRVAVPVKIYGLTKGAR